MSVRPALGRSLYGNQAEFLWQSSDWVGLTKSFVKPTQDWERNQRDSLPFWPLDPRKQAFYVDIVPGLQLLANRFCCGLKELSFFPVLNFADRPSV